jgi:FkbM family methyltransferase
MKKLIRQVAADLGLYKQIGFLTAKAKGYFKGIRIYRTSLGDYRIADFRGRSIIIAKRHAIYLSDIVTFFDFFFDAVQPDQNNEVHYEIPVWHTLRGFDRPMYFTSFAESTATLDLYRELVKIQPGDVIFDIGAYCGLTSIDFSRQVGETGHVYAFEPDPESFSALQINCEKFSLTNVSVEQLAIWKQSGSLTFQSDGTAGSSVANVSGRHDSIVSVTAITLADYISAHSIPRVNLIKIDAEGSESEILASSRAILRKFKPDLIVELHAVHDVMTTAECLSIVRQEGYQARIVPQLGTHFPIMVATHGT